MTRSCRSGIVVALAIGLLPGCASREGTGGPPTVETLTFRIVNRNWADMRVVVERNGMSATLGLVPSGRTETFVAPPGIQGGGALRLIGDPVGSRQSFATERFRADPGQVVEWTIRVRPAQSSLTIR